MNRNPHHITTTIATVLAAVTLSACEGTALDGEDLPRNEVTETIAAVTLEDGSQFRFYEPSPGELTVAVIAKGDEKPAALELLDSGELSAPELYRALANAEPPVALVDAQLRAEDGLQRAALDAAEGRLQIARPGASDETRVSSALTSTEFQSAYCGISGWDYRTCRLNYDLAFSVDFFGTSFVCRVHGEIGPTLMIYQAWNPFRIDTWTFLVDPHENYYVYTYGIPTRRKCDALPMPNPAGPRTRFDAMAGGDYLL